MEDRDIKVIKAKGGGCRKERAGRSLGMMELIEKARSDINKLTGLEPSSTIKTVKEDGWWRIDIEMIEKRSIPDSMDILAIYEVKIDAEGNILEFNRKGMRKRMESWAND